MPWSGFCTLRRESRRSGMSHGNPQWGILPRLSQSPNSIWMPSRARHPSRALCCLHPANPSPLDSQVNRSQVRLDPEAHSGRSLHFRPHQLLNARAPTTQKHPQKPPALAQLLTKFSPFFSRTCHSVKQMLESSKSRQSKSFDRSGRESATFMA